jgi:hypothetical protein
MKRTISFGWPLIWLVYSLGYDLGTEAILQGNTLIVPHTVPIWLLLIGHLIWATLTIQTLLSLYNQPGRRIAFAILMLVLWGFIYLSLTVQGYYFWVSFFEFGNRLHAFYIQLVSAEPGFFRLDAALLAVLGMFKWIRARRSTL